MIAMPPVMTPSIDQVFERDPVMAGLHRQFSPKKLRRKKQIYLRICSAIMSQQLSTKVADTLHRRFWNSTAKQSLRPNKFSKPLTRPCAQ